MATYTEILPGLFWLGSSVLQVSSDTARILDLNVLLTDQQLAGASMLGFKYLLNVEGSEQAAKAALKLYYRFNRVGMVMEGTRAQDVIDKIACVVVPSIDQDTRRHIVDAVMTPVTLRRSGGQ